MTARERRDSDPLWRSLVLARLARMRASRAARHTAELHRRWPPDNVIEGVLLRRRLAARCDGKECGDGPDN